MRPISGWLFGHSNSRLTLTSDWLIRTSQVGMRHRLIGSVACVRAQAFCGRRRQKVVSEHPRAALWVDVYPQARFFPITLIMIGTVTMPMSRCGEKERIISEKATPNTTGNSCVQPKENVSKVEKWNLTNVRVGFDITRKGESQIQDLILILHARRLNRFYA